MAGRGAEEGGRKPAGSESGKGPSSAHGSTAPGTETATRGALEGDASYARTRSVVARKSEDGGQSGGAFWRSTPSHF